MNQPIEKIFFSLVRYEIKGEELSCDIKNLISAETLPLIFKISKIHDLAHLIGDALDKNGLLNANEDYKNKFLKERNPKTQVIAVEPKRSPLLTKGYAGTLNKATIDKNNKKETTAEQIVATATASFSIISAYTKIRTMLIPNASNNLPASNFLLPITSLTSTFAETEVNSASANLSFK